MNILVTLNSNYVPPLTVLMRSIMRTNPGTVFDLYVAHSSLGEEDFARIRSGCDMTRTRIHPVTVAPELLADAPVLGRLSKETYYRLLAVDFLPRELDRILYIDPDTVVLRSLKAFYTMDMGNDFIAAAGHTKGLVEAINRRRLHMAKGSRYINAGVLLMNLNAMRREVRTDRIFEYIQTHAKTLYLGDQDVFNGMFSDRIRIVDETLYNLDEKTYHLHRRRIDLDWVRQNTVIVHYNGSEKPWKDNYRGELQGFYLEYTARPLPIGTKKERISA